MQSTTKRQDEVRTLFESGLSYRKIGYRLRISINTVKKHLANGRALDAGRELSPRQLEIIRLAAEDALTIKQIAQRLDIAVKTVQTHMYVIHRVLGVNNRVALVHAWLKRKADSDS